MVDNLPPGTTLGPYRIVGQIGQGGMATVYKAYQAAMDRYVALKVLPRQLAESPEFSGRFQQEARTIANLEHAHILPVHDYGQAEGFTYLVMRYLEAGTLKERLAAGELPLPEVGRLFSQLADALDYAHSRGVVHRDLKPSNVLVDQRGNLFLTDFGIAKLLQSDAHFTTTGGLIGTPAYMSPEQGEGSKVDQRSDIYSLGIILYEMVTGRVPFEAETPLAVVLKHLKEPLPLPTSVKPDVSPAIERVLLKALAKNSEDRFATMGEFLKAWKAAVAEEPTVKAAVAEEPTVKAAPAPRSALPARAGEARPKRGASPFGWILALGGLALVIVIVVVSLLGLRFIRQRRASARADATATAASAIVAPPAGSSGWTSWTAGNFAQALAVNGDQILSGGWGGVTVWNRADGSVLGQYTTANGLPNPHVTALLMDEQDGRLWIGTDYGLAVFDGTDWIYYTDADGLDSMTISSLGWWGDQLVVGTQYSGREGGGLNLWDGERWSAVPDFPSAHPDENPDVLANFVNATLEDGEGGLWVATANGLGHYDGETWTRYTTADGLPSNNIHTLFLDYDDEVWAGTEGGAAHFDGQTFEAAGQGPTYGVYGVAQDADGRYWFSGGDGVWRYDPENADWEEHSQQTGDMPSYGMLGITLDSDGNLYFGSEGSGIVQSDGQQFNVWQVENVPAVAAFGHIVAAPGGALWFIEEYGARVDTVDPPSAEWAPLPDQKCDCVPLSFSADGTMLGAAWDNGLWLVNGAKLTHVSADEGLPADHEVAAAALAEDGTVWIGTDHGLAQFDGQSVTQILTAEDTGFASDEVRALLVASDGSLWAGFDGGLSHLTSAGEWEHFGPGEPFSENFGAVYDLAQDSDGALWVATYGDGAYRFAGGEWENFTSSQPGVDLPSDSLNSVTVAPDGSVWFGTNYSGAARFDGSAWTTFDVPDLINWNVNAIYVEPNGTAWFATSGGVTRYVP